MPEKQICYSKGEGIPLRRLLDTSLVCLGFDCLGFPELKGLPLPSVLSLTEILVHMSFRQKITGICFFMHTNFSSFCTSVSGEKRTV